MIRRRIVASVSAVVLVSIVLAGYLILVALEDRLVANLDRDFRSGALEQDLRDLLAAGPGRPPREPDRFDPVRDIAVIVYGPQGAVRFSYPAGPVDDPAPLPAGDDLAPLDGITTISAVEGDGRYRAAAVELANGGRVVVAASMDAIEETLTATRRILLITGLAATAAIAGVSWVLIRRTFAPVEGMIATADRIAEGELGMRTGVDDTSSEVGRLGTALDTMLDRIEEAVDAKTASEERMRRFVAEASHELRTPLTSLRGYAELYRQGGNDPDTVEESMARIESEATRMSALVEDLLRLARLDRGPDQVTDPVDLTRLIGDAVDAVRVVDGDRTYDLDVPADPVHVLGDGHGLRQVLDNLLTNARLHTPSGTTVEVALTTTDDAARLVVADDGPGFSPPDRERAFDRLWRARRNDENPVEGSGLGLSIVRSIVEAHGGTVVLDDSLRGGARFTIDLPTAPRTTGSPTP